MRPRPVRECRDLGDARLAQNDRWVGDGEDGGRGLAPQHLPIQMLRRRARASEGAARQNWPPSDVSQQQSETISPDAQITLLLRNQNH